MPAARYWRIARIETFAGGDLELSGVALYEGATRVDGSATVSSVVAPVSGSLTDLGDASFGTSARWAGDAVRLPGFVVVWDFGAGVTKDVTSVEVAGPGQATFAHKFELEYSSDGAAWARLYKTPKASKWPGASAFFTLDAAGAALDLAGLIFVQDDGTVTPFRLESGGVLAAFQFVNAYQAGGRKMAVSDDGRFIAQADTSNTSDPRRLLIYEREGDAFTVLPMVDTYLENAARSAKFSHDSAYVAVGISSSPYFGWYKRDGVQFTKLTNPATLPTGNAASVSWSQDGTYVAVAHTTSPYITIYKRTGDTLAKLADPATLPSSTAADVAWHPAGTHLAVAHAVSPFVTIYSRSGDTFTKMANPATLPTGNAASVAFSSDGTYLVVGHTTSPFITIYKWSGSAYAKLPDPATLPASGAETVTCVAFDPTDTYLACGVQGAVRLVVYSRSGDTFTRMTDPAGIYSTSAAVSVSWFPFASTSAGLLPANYDATPLRTGDQAEPSMLGEDVAGFTQAFSAATPPQLDIYDAGRGRITGTVKERAYPADIPVKRRVALLSMPGSRAIRETWSDSVTGEYEFAEIAMDRTYTVVSYDHTGTYMGEVADNVQPTLMA